MKRNYCIAFVLLLFSIQTEAQFLTQSADGQGSILLPMLGMGIGFDLGKAKLTTGLNNYSNVVNSKDLKFKNNFLLGLNLSVENSEGLGKLYSTGDIVPASNILGIAGYSYCNRQNLNEKRHKKLDPLKIKSQKFTLELFSCNKENVLLTINSFKVQDNILQEKLDSLKNDVERASDNLSFDDVLLKFKNDKKIPDLLKEAISKAVKKCEDNLKENIEEINKDIFRTLDAFDQTHLYYRITPFIMGGIDAREFNLFSLDRINLPHSFLDTLSRGGRFGLGMNLQVNNYWLGVTYSYVDGDNFSGLTSKEYIWRTVDSSSNQTLSREKKYTPFSGNYSKVESNQLNIDLIGEFKLNDTSRLIANAYYRSSLFSRDTAYLKNYENIGIGLYFTKSKSKFIGGLYVELPDIYNEIEKTKAKEDRNIRSPFKKLTFGIVAKFSISSLLNFRNGPPPSSP
ncbi:MAG: hypothetical protein Q8K92_26450 [Leadbetterella sp.]|nr:hypothetical protein [Leadbetterella sp.]